MQKFRDSPFTDTLDVIATLRDRQIEASIAELRQVDELTLALRHSLRMGVSINDLSSASGLSPQAIRARVERELNFGDDLAVLAGTA
jgi:uncharacterized protein YerC